MEKFNLRKFLTENKLTNTSKYLAEAKTEKDGDYEITSKDGYVVVTYKGRTIGSGDYDRGARSFFMDFPSENKKGSHSFDSFDDIFDYVKKNNITEEVKLNEGLGSSEWSDVAKVLKRDVLGIARVAGPGASEQIDKAIDGLNDEVRDVIQSAAYDGRITRGKVEDAFDKSGLSSREFIKQIKQAARKI